LYFALLLLPFLYYEAASSFVFHGELGIGVGSILLTLNAVFLTLYTLGCHAWRHLIGGRLNCFSCGGSGEVAHAAWSLSSILNGQHMRWAWVSLYWILGTDVYIRLVSMGMITDLNTWAGF
jgi:hypothetical protein